MAMADQPKRQPTRSGEIAVISTFTDTALRQLLGELASLESSVERDRNAAREKVADAERELFRHGKSLSYLAMMHKELQAELAKREQMVPA